MRTGICRETPYGTGWLNIENTSIMSGIRQIGLGSNSLWALENQGNVLYRAGISKDRPEGTKWVQIPANMSNISVSACDQVKFIQIYFKALYFTNSTLVKIWAIDSNEMSLHLRSGMNAANQSGTGWKKIELKCKKIDRIRVNSSFKSIKIDEKIPTNNNSSPVSEKLIDNFIEDSFYDSIYEENAGNYLNEAENEIIKVEKPSNSFNQLNLNGLIIKNEFSVVLESIDNLSIDKYIDKYKTVETNSTETISASLLSNQSWDSSNSLEQSSSLQEDETNFYEEENIVETDLVVIGFKLCTANSFQLDQNRVPIWFSSGDFIQDGKINNGTTEVRNLILNNLKLRNLREHCHVDKITFPYENV